MSDIHEELKNSIKNLQTKNKQSQSVPEKDTAKSLATQYKELAELREQERNDRVQAKLMERLSPDDLDTARDDLKADLTDPKAKSKEDYDVLKKVLTGLTGDDLDYLEKSSKKKKYKKWYDFEQGTADDLTGKPPKKKKKKDYSKEFEPELVMLRNLLTSQNGLANDLLKRYQYMLGPAGSNGMPMNKTTVDLATSIINARNISLSILKEIASNKRTVADLYMKQAKFELDQAKLSNNSGDFDQTDIGLLGSSLVGNATQGSPIGQLMQTVTQQQPVAVNNDMTDQFAPVFAENETKQPIQATVTTTTNQQPSVNIEEFNPAEWNDESINTGDTKFETIPHKIVVIYNKEDKSFSYKAIDPATEVEIPDCPIPPFPIVKYSEEKGTAIDTLNNVYDVIVV